MHQTPLHEFHVSHGARMVEFAGWHMPIMYTSILDEHHYTRQHCCLLYTSPSPRDS